MDMIASERLSEAETSASNDHRRAQREPRTFHSSIYPAGSEFALCHAEAQLMIAVVGVLNENLMESIKGFYKLRKAYMTLDTILEAEKRYMRARNGASINSTRRNSFNSLRSDRSARSTTGMPGGFGDSPPRSAVSQNASYGQVSDVNPSGKPEDLSGGLNNEPNDEDEEFYDADEIPEGAPMTGTYLGHVDVDVDVPTSKMENTSLQSPKTPNSQKFSTPFSPRSTRTTQTQEMLNLDPDSDIFTNSIDAFIHSGSNLCFGLLLLLISLIPPAFGKLLFIIGFHGDRERGLRMLWQASKFHNINGAMAGLIVLGYYNNLVGFCDVLPDSNPSADEDDAENLGGYPLHRLESLLADMRNRYPKSHLWLLEESRMQACHRRLDKAIDLLSGDTRSLLKQVEALSMFEKALYAMYSHRYLLCADSFITCCSLNNWSHALYYYIAGSCHVELYRLAKAKPDTVTAKKHAEKAVELLQTVRAHAGKKKFMARQLPFDIFVVRKLSKWEARAKDWGVPLIDAIGVSPMEEMIYLWNGIKRMDRRQLEASLEVLACHEDPAQNSTWLREGLDEKAILAVLRAATYRNLNRWDDAKSLLKTQVIAHDRTVFKGQLKDDWTCPTAHYEMGANLWAQRTGAEGDAALVREAQEWVEKAAKWEGYELDARIGLKVTTAQETMRKWREGR